MYLNHMNIPSPPLSGMNWRTQLSLLNCIILLLGLVFSPPLLSIGLIGISVVGILHIPKGINPVWKQAIATGIRDPFNWAFATLYLILLLGFWQTEDWSYYTERLRIKLALLTVPIGWWGLPKWTKGQQQFILAFFIGLMIIVAIGVLINYAIHFEAIQTAIAQGQAMPVPRNHIRFSLLVALATLAALELWRVKGLKQQKLWLFAALFLFLFQHVLAVRSGLLGAYLSIAAMLLLFIVQGQKKTIIIGATVFLLLIPILAFQHIPSLQKKIAYFSYELWIKERGMDQSHFSDAGRFTSIRLGYTLWQSKPWLGVGPGNLRMEMNKLYASQYPNMPPLRPHNQFVSVLAGSGLLGFIPFLIAFIYLLLGKARWKKPIFLATYLLLLASCMVENTLENSSGIGMFCFFLFFFAKAYDAGNSRIAIVQDS